MTPDTFNFEVCIPVSAALPERPDAWSIAASPRVAPHVSCIAAAEDFESAWGGLMRWIDAQGSPRRRIYSSAMPRGLKPERRRPGGETS